jgi:hypothetical protein
MSEIKEKIKYHTFKCLSNKEHGVIFVDIYNLENEGYTIQQLGDKNLEYIDTIDIKQDDDRVVKRITIFAEYN